MTRCSYERKICGSMREQKALNCPLELKMLQEDGRFAGYASVFGLVDNQRDVVLEGAFRRTIHGRVADIKLLWQHSPAEPVGYFTTMFEDARGLYVEGRLMMGLEKAREAYELLKSGVVKGLSIGYSPVRYSVDPDSGVRRLAEVDLWEVSLVTFPANASANVTVVKGRKGDDRASVAEIAAFRAAVERLVQVGR